jgi:D-alanyl-D-alanine carboxypeptidase
MEYGTGAGDVINYRESLKMMLVSSYNDAAIVLAEIFGSEEFLSLMNEKASILGLSNTHFSNPCGLIIQITIQL